MVSVQLKRHAFTLREVKKISANKEDYVSIGTAATVKARNAINNAAQVLAIELLCASQALDLRAPLEPGRLPASCTSSREP